MTGNQFWSILSKIYYKEKHLIGSRKFFFFIDTQIKKSYKLSGCLRAAKENKQEEAEPHPPSIGG